MTSSLHQSGKNNGMLTHSVDNYDQKSWNYYQVLFMSHGIVQVLEIISENRCVHFYELISDFQTRTSHVKCKTNKFLLLQLKNFCSYLFYYEFLIIIETTE